MLSRKSLLILVTNTIGAFAGLVALFVIGRYMGPTPYGMFAFSLSIVSLGAFLTRLGYDNAHIKRVSEGEDLARCNGTYLRIKALLITVFVLGVSVAVILWDRFQGFFDATTASVVFVTLAYAVLLEVRLVPTATFDALRQTARTQTLNIVEHVVKTPLLIIFALAYGLLNGRWVPFGDIVEGLMGRLGVVGPVTIETGALLIALAHGVALLVSVIAAFALFRYHGMPIGGYDPALARSYTRFAIPIAVVSSLHLIANHLDAFMIGYFWNAREVGYYYAAVRITTMVIIVPVAVRTLFFPTISQLSRAGDTEGVRTVARSTQRLLSLGIVLLTMFILMFAEEGIHIFLSDSFLPAAETLRLLAIYTFIVSTTTIASSLILGHDRPKTIAAIGIVSVVSNITLNFVFIPESILGVPLLGLRSAGAALATVTAQTIALVLLVWYSRRLTGETHFGMFLVKHIAAAAITAGVLHLLYTPVLGSVDRVWELAAAGILGTILYLGILILLREVTRKDLLMFYDLFHPIRMIRYVREEVGGRKKD
ncbi:MAG: flippase [Euryarchaeota archaeon]|nr:flippase [Euryarchaeota archaeon]